MSNKIEILIIVIVNIVFCYIFLFIFFIITKIYLNVDENKILIDIEFSINDDSSNMSIEKIVKNEININKILKLIVINTVDKKSIRTIISKFLTIFSKIVLSTTQSTD